MLIISSQLRIFDCHTFEMISLTLINWKRTHLTTKSSTSVLVFRHFNTISNMSISGRTKVSRFSRLIIDAYNSLVCLFWINVYFLTWLSLLKLILNFNSPPWISKNALEAFTKSCKLYKFALSKIEKTFVLLIDLIIFKVKDARIFSKLYRLAQLISFKLLSIAEASKVIVPKIVNIKEKMLFSVSNLCKYISKIFLKYRW